MGEDHGSSRDHAHAAGVKVGDGLTVETAAIRIGETVFTLPRPNRHHNIIWWLSVLGVASQDTHDQGFVLNNGQFVSRTLAAKIALRNGQVERLIAPPHLYSEDLWSGGADLPSHEALKVLAAADRAAPVQPNPNPKDQPQ